MLPYHRQLLFLFLALSEGMVSEYHIIAIPTLDNKVLSDPLFGIRYSDSISGCAVLCVDKCRFFSFNSQTGMCRHYCQWNNRTNTDTESGWRTYNKISLEVADVRLIGGNYSGEGRVEVWYNNRWGTVCDDGFDDIDAQVVCRQLGYACTAKAVSSAHFGEGSGQIWMDNVDCGGSETSLTKCFFRGFGNHNCHHTEDVGVICH